MPDTDDTQISELLRQRFGHDEFRPGQREIILALLAGRDVVAVLPTGAGKSLIYQLAAQLLPRATLVVSPLLALMKDQIDSLASVAIDARMISSQQSETEVQDALKAAGDGSLKLLYVTPERFESREFVEAIQRIGVSLFVVDEAHSISEWGHSFRPAYLALGDAIAQLGRPTVLALTATATEWVRRDIVEHLGIRHPLIRVRGTDRPNLFLEVVTVQEEREDKGALGELFFPESSALPAAIVSLMEGSGIIYTATTRGAEGTAAWLREWGIAAEHYHGRMRKSARDDVQSRFMEGGVRVIVATNAFGLGVDKPDVRFVIHRDVPASVEAYYQEAGRAGRDGELARCTLIYREGDLHRAAFLAATGQLTVDDLERAHTALRTLGSATVPQLQKASGLGRGELERVVELLEEDKIVRVERGRVRLLRADFDPESISLEGEAQRRQYARSRVEMMRTYAELRECRRRYILNYFGEEPEWARCERCDVDMLHQHTSANAARPSGAFAINDRVEHRSLGGGVVQRVTDDTVTVLFDKSGYKTLALDLIVEADLLRITAARRATR